MILLRVEAEGYTAVRADCLSMGGVSCCRSVVVDKTQNADISLSFHAYLNLPYRKLLLIYFDLLWYGAILDTFHLK